MYLIDKYEQSIINPALRATKKCKIQNLVAVIPKYCQIIKTLYFGKKKEQNFTCKWQGVTF